MKFDSSMESTPKSSRVGRSYAPVSDISLGVSIYECILSLWIHRGGKSELRNVDLAMFPHEKVNYLPTQFNRKIVFELLPLLVVKGGGSSNVGRHG